MGSPLLRADAGRRRLVGGLAGVWVVLGKGGSRGHEAQTPFVRRLKAWASRSSC